MSRRELIVCAHPDDETLWFSAVAMRGTADVICVTCGSDQDREVRQREFHQACDLLGIKRRIFLNYPDITFQSKSDFVDIARIDIESLKADLRAFVGDYQDATVYTHSPYGEVNEHPHHQDVSCAVYGVFPSVLSISWNLHPDKTYLLTKEEYTVKKHILGTIYAREYSKLKTTYPILPVESFVKLSPDSVDLFYWSIANFGDRHERLGERHQDMWGYRYSPYERERHQRIRQLAMRVKPKRILEIGAHEGCLSSLLREVAELSVTETSEPHRRRLLSGGFNLIDAPVFADFDLTVISNVLEYFSDPASFLREVNSRYLIVDVIQSEGMERIARSCTGRYELIAEEFVSPRWENMFHDHVKEKLEVYRLGAHIFLYERR